GAQNATITDLTEQLGLALSSCGNSTAALLELLAETQSQVTVNRDGWAAANATITTLEEAVTQCELERTELRANLTQSEAERAFLQGFLDQANEIIAQIQALNITGNGTVVDEGNLVETIEGLLSQIDSFEQREAEQNELVTQLRANFTEVSALLESCSSNHSLALATIQGLQAQVASLQGNVTLLAEIIATQDARISEYETELESIDFALAINGSAANRTQAIVALNMRIFQLETALNASTEVNVNLTTLIAECVQERDSLRADVSSLEAANAVLQNTTIALQELTAEQAVQIQTANATISVYQTTVLSLEELIQAYQSLETSVLAQLTQTQADVAMCEQTLGACQGRVGLADESGSGDDGSGSGDFGSSLGTLSIAELGQRLSGTAAAFAQCNAQLQACHTSEVAEKDARIAELTQQRDLLSQRDQENQAFLSTLPAVVALMNEDSAKLTCLATRLNVSLTQELTHLQQAARVGVAADGTCIDPTAANPTSTAALQASMARLQALNESIAVCNMRSARVEKELQVCQSLIAASQVVPGVPCPEAVNAKAGFGENTGYTFTGVLLILAALGGGGYVAAHKVKLDAEDRDWWASMKHYIGCCCKSSSRSRVAPQNDFPMQQLNRHGDAAAAGELSEVITVAPANGQLRVGRRDGVVPGRNLPPLMERGATTAAAAAAATLPTAGDSKPQPPKPRALPPMNAGLSAKPAAAVQRAQPETLGGGNTRRSSAWGTAATAAAATLPTAGNSKPQPPAPGTKMKFNPGFRRSSALGTAAPAAASVVSEGEERAVRPQAETLGGNTPAGSPDRRAVTFATTPLPGAVTYGETPTEEYDGGGVALDMITPTRTASNTAQSRERLARSFRTATVTANRMKDVEAINKLLKHANDPAHLEKSAITLIRYLHEKRVPAEKVDEVNAVIRAQTSKISSVYLDAGNSESLETRLHASGGSMKIFIARVRALKAALEEAGCPLNEETVRPSLASSDIGAKRQACLTPVQIRELPDEQDQNVLRAYFISLPQKDAVGRTSEA
ncbi:MAG: hypothetical protein O3A01_07930, partial [bacterium]|nr:hypothetical protein [bacterium]